MAKFKLPRLSKPLIWLLLPVALLAGRPMVGCVCSDGTYKVSCEKLSGSFLWANSTKQQASCCPNANTSSCPACHPSSENRCDGVSSRNECVCNGIENNLKLTSSKNLEQHQQVVSFACFAIPGSDCSPVRALHDLEGTFHGDLPPPDRVVLFLHLTI